MAEIQTKFKARQIVESNAIDISGSESLHDHINLRADWREVDSLCES